MEKKNIQVFRNPRFGEIRTVIGENDEPMFCAKDVATALGYADTADAIQRHCKSGKKVFHPHTNGIGGVNMVFITEKDVYRLIMRSNLPDAEKFQDWVCEEVLPAIRKTGGYIATKDGDTPEMIMARAVLVAKATIEKQNRQIAEQTAKIEADAPKVLFAESLKAADRSILVGELAKILKQNGVDTGQKRLFEYLRNNGYLMKSGSEKNQPTQRSMEMGLFEMTTRTVAAPDGLTIAKVTTKVTVKGQEYFINKLTERGTVK